MYNATKDIAIPIVTILISVVVAYLTSTYAINREANHGRLRLLELVRRYFLNLLQAVDLETKQVKQDALSKQMYVEELAAILGELQHLVAHPYFSVLIKRYPTISMLLLQVRREVVGHSAQPSFGINEGTMTRFWHLYQMLHADMPRVIRSELDATIVNLAHSQGLKNLA